MALGKRRDAPSIIPTIKIDARSGRVMRADREQDSSGKWVTRQTDIATDDFEAIFDLENTEVGWMAFTGGKPDFHMKRAGADIGEPPSKDHKEGFRVRMKLQNGAGDDVREFSSTSKVIWQSLDELHTEYLEEVVKQKGKLPVVGIAEMARVAIGSGTYYRPVFEITSWVKRPSDLTK
jgi:hypothetical protein